MRNWLVLAALAVAGPVWAEEAPVSAPVQASAPAQAFAHAWLDRDLTMRFTQTAFQDKVDRCISRGATTQEQIDAARPRLDAYLTAFFNGFGRAQDKVAAKAQTLLSVADMRELTRLLLTPMMHTMRREALAGMSQRLVPAIPGCGDEGKSITVSQLGAAAMPHLSQAEIASLRKLVVNPAWQHLNRVLPVLVPVVMQAYRDEVVHALQTIGASQELQDKVQAQPSMITVDPPAPSPAH